MATRGQIVIDLCDSSPEPEPGPVPEAEPETSSQPPRRSQQSVPDSHVLTPDNSDEDERDESPQILWHTRNRRHDASASNTLKSHAPANLQKNAPLGTTADTNIKPPRPVPIKPSNSPAAQPPRSRLQNQSRPSVPSQSALSHQPNRSRPVSILSPETQQWLSRVKTSRTATPSISTVAHSTNSPLAPSEQYHRFLPPSAEHSHLSRPPNTHRSQAAVPSSTPLFQNPRQSLPPAVPTSLAQAPKSLRTPPTAPKTGHSPRDATSEPGLLSTIQRTEKYPSSSLSRPLRTTGDGSPSSDDSFVTAADNEIPTNPISPTTNPRPLINGKRKLVEIADISDTVSEKRTRRSRSSTGQQHAPDPFTTSASHYSEALDSLEIEDDQSQFSFPQDISQIRPFPNNFGKPFTPKEDALVQYLKLVKNLPWKEFEPFFPGRRWPSLQTRWSKVLSPRLKRLQGSPHVVTSTTVATPPTRPATRQDRPSSYSAMAREPQQDIATHEDFDEIDVDSERCRRVPRSISYLMRHREMGLTGGHESPRRFHSAVKDLAYSTLGAEAYMDNASGDVSTVAWSPDGECFAAGAVAVTDQDSVQYNKPRNLIIGNPTTHKARELPEHKMRRSLKNGSYKDLFSTIQMVQFSPDSSHLYSVSIDKQLNTYKIDKSLSETELVSRLPHPAPVDFLSINNNGLIATGCAYSGPGAIRVLPSTENPSTDCVYFSGSNATPQSKKYPSALKWGTAAGHQNYLLAGFSCETEVFYVEDDQRDKEGEVALWDVRTGQNIEVSAPNRNVFDLSWNPNSSPASSIFAVASGVIGKVSHGMHSVVRLYSPKARVQHVIELECPAWDINDVCYSPHDDNLIAVGSTEGKVYIWDVRFAKHTQLPLRTLKHGESLAILPDEKRRWEADTGVRFLSWGSERDRLYTGSSDGLVKCWDPYRSDEEKHVRDVAKFSSAVMSGAFSPDNCSLLIGEDSARLNLLTIGNGGVKFDRQTKKFDVSKEPMPEEPVAEPIDCQELLTTGGLEIRPIGTMPFRQVVQGANYNGPYLRDDDETGSREKAQRFQEKALRMLRRRNKQLRKSGHPPVEACHLDCGHIPLQEHEREENGRSDDRIPEQLWDWVAPGGAGFRLGRPNTCSMCGGAARFSEENKQNNGSANALCEKCGFACFRCGQMASISPRGKAVECQKCGLAWQTGALGYQLIAESRAETAVARKWIEQEQEVEEDESVVDLGEDERENFLRECSSDDSLSDDSLVAGH